MSDDRTKRLALADELAAHGWGRRDFPDVGSTVMDSPAPAINGAVRSVYIGPRGAVEARIAGSRDATGLAVMSDAELLVWLGLVAPR